MAKDPYFSLQNTVRQNFSVEIRQGLLIVNEIDIAKLNLPPKCTKVKRFSSLAQPQVGAAYAIAGTRGMEVKFHDR